ncbi:TetR/AcrR family transcriptional regulator [Zhongshania sp.]|uniref:TetR/AcrR family transcriptional regulator n=1 Tax=Zhongshania sp. TaxID=1971902 RepID=UPI001B7B3AD2|nr:TetR/AcrR family transcriptional regulator [Zhongshania sp.]MBQ0795053.1 TetR/AcrR family transcriptional regulator [Zhongshania sp.]|tara:strand:+ start:1125 stop:1721 length:597 start_codon:yes stop_codon:yes gene_type:complete
MARPYMNKIARRQMLLDTASGIVDEYGWNTLSMISLAEHGGVSRQLVYQNFDSINTLTEQTASYMFEELYTEIQDVLRKHSDDIVVAITKAQHVLFSFPEGRVQALWALLADNTSHNTPFSAVSRRYRKLISDLYTPIISRTMNIDTQHAGQVAWLLMMSFWGGQQLIHDKTISKTKSLELIQWYIERLVAGCKASEA